MFLKYTQTSQNIPNTCKTFSKSPRYTHIHFKSLICTRDIVIRIQNSDSNTVMWQLVSLRLMTPYSLVLLPQSLKNCVNPSGSTASVPGPSMNPFTKNTGIFLSHRLAWTNLASGKAERSLLFLRSCIKL